MLKDGYEETKGVYWAKAVLKRVLSIKVPFSAR